MYDRAVEMRASQTRQELDQVVETLISLKEDYNGLVSLKGKLEKSVESLKREYSELFVQIEDHKHTIETGTQWIFDEYKEKLGTFETKQKELEELDKKCSEKLARISVLEAEAAERSSKMESFAKSLENREKLVLSAENEAKRRNEYLKRKEDELSIRETDVSANVELSERKLKEATELYDNAKRGIEMERAIIRADREELEREREKMKSDWAMLKSAMQSNQS